MRGVKRTGRAVTPKKRVPLEHETQAAIVDALRLAGVTVFETTAYRQKGPSGVDRAIPDLLLSDADACTYTGIEVKRPVKDWKYSSLEQEIAHKEGRFVVVQTLEQALSVAASQNIVPWENVRRVYSSLGLDFESLSEQLAVELATLNPWMVII